MTRRSQMMKAADTCCVVAVDTPLTQDELIGRDDHAANVWRLVVEICSSMMIMPRRASASKSDVDISRHSFSQAPAQNRICVIASEVDHQLFNSSPKSNCYIIDKRQMSCSKQTVTSRLLTLLRRKTKGSETERSTEGSVGSDRSSSPASVSTDLTQSDTDSLAAYASNEPSAWKKVQAYVLKNDKWSVEECNGRFVKPITSSSLRSKSVELPSERGRKFVFKSEIDPQKYQRRYSGDDSSKSFNEYFNLPAFSNDLQSSRLSSEDVLQTSTYLSSSILPPADNELHKLGIISDLFSTNEKEDIEEEFDPIVISQKVIRRRMKEIRYKTRTIPFISSFRSALGRLRRRQQSRISKADRDKVKKEEEEPSLTISRSISIDVVHADLLNVAV